MAARTSNAKVGRPPLPTALKLLRGEVKRDRINLDEPKVAAGLPARPEGMIEGADAEWDHIMAVLGPTGAITLADAEAVRQFAETTVTYRQLVATYNATGGKAVIRNRAGEVAVNPILAAIDKARTAQQIAAREIGATPSSRGQIRVKQSPTADPFEKFLTTKPAIRRAAGG